MLSGCAAFGASLALVCALGLAGCGQSASEPGGAADNSGASAGQSSEVSEQDSAQGDASEAGASASSAQEGSTASEASDASTHGDSLDADEALEGQTDPHPVQFTINAPDYSSSDGKIPIAISGTRVDGTMVDATAYLGPDGSGLELSPGQYTVTVIESPLLSGGRFFRAPGKSWDVVVGDTLASGEGVSVEGSINFTEMDLSELTEDEVNTAYTYAVSGGLPTSTANKYKKELLKAAGLS